MAHNVLQQNLTKMERPKIDNYIKKDPSELTNGEILIGYQKYAKALDDYINEQLHIDAVNCCALLEELNLKLIAMSCFAQEHFHEKAYDVTKMNIDEIMAWIHKKRSHHCH